MPEEDAPVATTAENAYHNVHLRRVSQYTWVAKNCTPKGAGSLDLLEELVDLNLPDLRPVVSLAFGVGERSHRGRRAATRTRSKCRNDERRGPDTISRSIAKRGDEDCGTLVTVCCVLSIGNRQVSITG